jgi:pyrimidine-nucleoside phosphorylase
VALPYRILERKRGGLPLTAAEIGEVVSGAVDGSWSEGQLAAFLMAAAIRGLDARETRALTLAVLDSGERWDLARELPGLCDKHSTGGVGDKASLTLAPLLASCGVPMAMLAGRGLGHTGGTADKLEGIPGLDLGLDRGRCLSLLARCGMACGVATERIAPADRRLYALRDATATIDSLPLVIASIVAKKLALGAAAIVFDVKCGNGAFFPQPERARELARGLVDTTTELGRRAVALVSDMSQPLGRWVGHHAEVAEALAVLGGGGPADLRELTLVLAEEVSRLAGRSVGRAALEAALAGGQAHERFMLWASLQGADAGWLRNPRLPLAPVERPLAAARTGRLAGVDTRQLGLLLIEAGAGRARAGQAIDHAVALRVDARLGDAVERGEELGRLYLRRDEPGLVARFAACFAIGESAERPALVVERIAVG